MCVAGWFAWFNFFFFVFCVGVAWWSVSRASSSSCRLAWFYFLLGLLFSLLISFFFFFFDWFCLNERCGMMTDLDWSWCIWWWCLTWVVCNETCLVNWTAERRGESDPLVIQTFSWSIQIYSNYKNIHIYIYAYKKYLVMAALTYKNSGILLININIGLSSNYLDR